MGRNRLNGAHCRRLAVEGIAHTCLRPEVGAFFLRFFEKILDVISGLT